MAKSTVGRGSGRPTGAKYQEIPSDAHEPRRRRVAIIKVPLDANGVPDLIAMRNQEMAKALEDCSTFDLLVDIARNTSTRNADRIAAIKEIHRLQELGIKMQMLAAGLDGEGGPVGGGGGMSPELRALRERAEEDGAE